MSAADLLGSRLEDVVGLDHVRRLRPTAARVSQATAAALAETPAPARAGSPAAPSVAATTGLGPLPPLWLARPGSAAELASLLGVAALHRLTVAVGERAGERAQLAAQASGRPGVVVDLGRMDRVLELEEASLYVHAQAGIPLAGLVGELASRGLSFGDFAAPDLDGLLGARLARRSLELASPISGTLEEACLGLSAVLPDGRLLHTRVAPRHAAGPDLMRLLLGGEGCLGILTSAVLRTVRMATPVQREAADLANTVEAIEVARALLEAGVRPNRLTVFDCREPWNAKPVSARRSHGALLWLEMGGPSDLVAAVLELLRDQVRERRGCLLDAESVQAVRVFEEAAPEAAEVSRRLELHAPVPRLAAVHGAVRARLEQGPFTRIVGRVAQFSGHDACVRFRALPKTDAQPTAVAAAVRDARQAGRAAGGRPLDDPPPEVCLERVQALRRLVDPEAVLLPQMLWLAAQSEEMLHPEGRAARTPATTSAPR